MVMNVCMDVHLPILNVVLQDYYAGYQPTWNSSTGTCTYVVMVVTSKCFCVGVCLYSPFFIGYTYIGSSLPTLSCHSPPEGDGCSLIVSCRFHGMYET